MKNSLLILNQEKASLSNLGYDEIVIMYLILKDGFPQNDTDDDYMGPFYSCKCFVKEGDIHSVIEIPLIIIEKEIQKDIYKISLRI